MQNPKVPELVKKRVRSEAAQGGTCPEGTSQSPQKGAQEQASGGRSGEK